MITPDEYETLRKQKDSKILQYVQENLEKFIEGTDFALKNRAEKGYRSPTVSIDAFIRDDSDYAYALADAIAKAYAKCGWFIYDNSLTYPAFILMRFSRKRLWWRRAWAKPGV